MTILFHRTKSKAVPGILREGLRPNAIGIVYLSPKRDGSRPLQEGETLLAVTIRDQRLTAFEDCADWEVLCWGSIPPEDIRVIDCRPED